MSALKSIKQRYAPDDHMLNMMNMFRKMVNECIRTGVPVVYVTAWGTSSKCSRCGSDMKPEENRMLEYVSCGLCIDRDLNAARNILARGLRFKPVGPPSEAMIVERSQELIHRVDGSQSSHQTKT